MDRRLIAFATVVFFLLGAGPTLANNTVTASTTAKLGPPTSQFGLLVHLDDAAPRNATYVLAGPAQGFNNETTLSGSFFIDPQNLTMSTSAGVNSFQMVDFLQSVGGGASDRVHLIFHLNHGADNNWYINVWHWNQTLNGGAGNWQFSGGGFFAIGSNVNWHNNRIDFVWNAGNPGHLTMSRTRYINGAPDASGTIQMFSVNLPGQTSAIINYVFAGMFTSQDPGTGGNFYLDEFTFNR